MVGDILVKYPDTYLLPLLCHSYQLCKGIMVPNTSRWFLHIAQIPGSMDAYMEESKARSGHHLKCLNYKEMCKLWLLLLNFQQRLTDTIRTSNQPRRQVLLTFFLLKLRSAKSDQWNQLLPHIMKNEQRVLVFKYPGSFPSHFIRGAHNSNIVKLYISVTATNHQYYIYIDNCFNIGEYNLYHSACTKLLWCLLLFYFR